MSKRHTRTIKAPLFLGVRFESWRWRPKRDKRQAPQSAQHPRTPAAPIVLMPRPDLLRDNVRPKKRAPQKIQDAMLRRIVETK